MGVPKFYRWISERYPCLSTVVKEYQIPDFDNLYLDMNGIIHVCSHPNDDDPHFRITEDKIFLDICNYIDFLFRMIKPKKTFFMAVDGVAPRAKMNQQRGRRFKSAKEAAALEKQALEKGETLPTEARFDSNCISPGTEFMARLQDHLKMFVACKVSTDPLWQNVKVYLSGHQTPGEGEHKVMDFIRAERSQPGYDPNTRHCLYGLDADLIMLGICSHEPHFALLREEIVYGKRQNQKRLNVPEEITFHLLHLSLLREYLELEFQAVKKSLPFEFNLESIIDDWVLMCFLVGNDFIPHLPNLHIAHNALPILYKAYIDVLPKLKGYINESGKLNLDRFEKFLERLSEFDYEKFSDVQADQKFLQSKRQHAEAPNGIVKNQNGSPSGEKEKARDPDEQRLMDKFQHLDIPDYDSDEETEGLLEMEFRQHKRDYYVNKLEYKDVNKEVMQEQAHGYVRAIQWNLHYYYNGVQSWNWYYPHHYSPYISDIRDFQNLDMTFDMGKPFLPFQQLMAILPAASKNLVPRAYQDLMECETSPILDYYPKDFATDLNGKQHDWEAVVLIPFIDENRLLPAMEQNQQKLTEEERARNGHRGHLLFTYSKEEQPPLPWLKQDASPLLMWQTNHAHVVEVDAAAFRLPIAKIRKGLLEGSKLDIYFPGFPTFKHLEYTGKMGKESIKVFQALTRNESMIISIVNKEERSLKDIATELLGKCVHVHWPHLLEAVVVEVSNREERFSLDTSKQGKSSSSTISQEALSKKEQEIFELKIDAIREKSMGRYGVNFGDIDVLVDCKTLTGRRHVCSSKGRVTFEKQWSEHSVPFALQSLVKGLTEHAPDFVECKTIQELFPNGSQCFMVGHPHYGCQGKVVDAEPADKVGRVLVKFVVPVEPNLAGVIRNEQNLHRVHYMSAHQLSQQLGVNTQFVSRITGTVFVQMNSKEAETASLINVGLNLKFNKTCEEIPGYSRKANESWQYSSKCLEVLQKYVEQYLNFVQRILPFMSQDKIAVEDLYPKGIGKEEVREVAKWIKEQECSQVPRVKSGAVLLDEGVVQAIEETVDKARVRLPAQEVVLDVHPKHLFRPGLQLGWVAPDEGATYQMFDRVVNVRENFAVPLGFRGTIIGFLPKEENEPQMCEVLFDEPFPGGLPLRCSVDRGYRLSTLFLVNLSYGSRSQRSMQLYQVPARRQQQLDSSGPYSQVMSGRPRVSSGRPEPIHATRGHGWEEESPQRRPGKNRFHHSPNSPFEAQKGSPAPEGTSEATSDFASLWLGLQKAGAQKPSEVPAQESGTSSQHQGTPVSLDELFKGAKQLEQRGTEYTPVSSSASILEDLVKRTKEVMGAEPEHFCVGMDGQPPRKFKAFVSLPNGRKFASACMDNQKSALHDAAQQALAFLDEKPLIPQAAVRMPLPVPALRPSVPLPFGSAPPPSALPGFARGTRFELRPRCEASLIPDSFVESNRHLMETLNALPPDDHPPQQQQQQHHRLPGGGPLSWQMPRMPAPMRHPGGSPRKMQHQQQQQQFPYYHRPNPCNVFVPRPPSLIYQQEQEPYRLQPPADSLLRFPNPAGGRSPHKDGHGRQQQAPAQRQGHQQPSYPRAHGRQGNHPEPHLPRTATFPEHQLSATASAFVPTQVMRKSSKPGPAANGSKSPMKKEAAASKAAATASEQPAERTAKAAPKPAAKLKPAASSPNQPEAKPVAKSVPQPSPNADNVLEPKRTSSDTSVVSEEGASSEAKARARRSRLALKFESTPGAS